MDMTFKDALNNLCANYGQYFTREQFRALLFGSIEEGLSVHAAYIAIKMNIVRATDEVEFFTVDDIMEVTGESREEIQNRIEEYKEELEAAGIDPDTVAPPIKEVYRYIIRL